MTNKLEAMDELLPCPFCGGNDVRLYSPALSRLIAAHCQDCEIRGTTAIDADIAVSNWNTRAALAPQPSCGIIQTEGTDQ